MRLSYKYTIYACYIGYIIQAIIININPILFATYMRVLGVPVEQIGSLITLSFGIQVLVDFIAAKHVDKLGYRKCVVFSHIISVMGMASLGILPNVMSNPFIGLVISTVLNGIGGGLLEVLVSPMVEAAPGEEKEKAMSMLHSFYCWGCVGFILVSTLIMSFISDEQWFILPLIWMIVPLVNTFFFTVVPINVLTEKHEKASFFDLAKNKVFWLFVLLMMCSGAAEQSMSQWASYFAEIGLGVSKTVGDLLGPCAFCFLMGVSRAFYGKKGETIKLEKFMKLSCLLCVGAYLLTVFAPTAILSLVGCAICGLAVGILWPGTYSLAVANCRMGGTALFAFLALAGDIGCVTGPTIVGMVSSAGFDLKVGLAVAMIFPLIMLIFVRFVKLNK